MNDGQRVDLSAIEDQSVVGDLLKTFVREMPDPLLTFELYDVFLEQARLSKRNFPSLIYMYVCMYVCFYCIQSI